MSDAKLSPADKAEERSATHCARAACITAIRRVIDAVHKETGLVNQLRQTIYPILNSCLQDEDNMECVEDAISIMTLVTYHGVQHGSRIHPDMWRLYTILLYSIAGYDDEEQGGHAFEYLPQATQTIENFISNTHVHRKGLHQIRSIRGLN